MMSLASSALVAIDPEDNTLFQDTLEFLPELHLLWLVRAMSCCFQMEAEFLQQVSTALANWELVAQ